MTLVTTVTAFLYKKTAPGIPGTVLEEPKLKRLYDICIKQISYKHTENGDCFQEGEVPIRCIFAPTFNGCLQDDGTDTDS